MNKALASTALIASLSATSAMASDDFEFGLGLGVASGKSPYTGVGTETSALPIIMVDKGNFHWFGATMSYDLYASDQMSFSVLGQYRGEGFEASDSTALAGMSEREGAFEMGLGAEFYSNYGTWSAEVLTDVSGTHEGYEVALGWSQDYQLSQKWTLSPNLGVSYRSDKLNDYYFGVNANEATATRAAYDAGSGLITSVGLDARYMIDQQQMIMMGISVESYSSDIKDSPIVERNNSTGLMLGYLYRF